MGASWAKTANSRSNTPALLPEKKYPWRLAMLKKIEPKQVWRCPCSCAAWLVLVGPSTWIPITWLHTKQTCTSKSTTEAETVAFVNSLLHDAYPVWDLLELMFKRKVTLRIKEDSTATIKV